MVCWFGFFCVTLYLINKLSSLFMQHKKVSVSSVGCYAAVEHI